MTLIRAECSMISARDDLSGRSGQGWIGTLSIVEAPVGTPNRTPFWGPVLPVGALRDAGGVQGGSFVAEPFGARPSWALGAILGAEVRERLVEHRVTPGRRFFAIMCHLRPSTLSTGAPCPVTSTRARRFFARSGCFAWRALAQAAPPRRSRSSACRFPFIERDGNIRPRRRHCPASDAACRSRTALLMSFSTPVSLLVEGRGARYCASGLPASGGDAKQFRGAF